MTGGDSDKSKKCRALSSIPFSCYQHATVADGVQKKKTSRTGGKLTKMTKIRNN